MRILVQNVDKCEVCHQSGEFISKIDKGVVCYIGIDKSDIKYKEGDWDVLTIEHVANVEELVEVGVESLMEIAGNGDMMILSQFTLFGTFKKSKKPTFHHAAPVEIAKEVFNRTVQAVKEKKSSARSGIFRTALDIKATSTNLETTVHKISIE